MVRRRHPLGYPLECPPRSGRCRWLQGTRARLDGYLPTDEDVLREELTRRGLDVCSGTCCYQFDRYASFDDFRAPVDALCKRLTAFGAKYLVAMDESDFGLYSEKKADFPAEVWNNFLEKIRLMGEFTKNKYGVEVVYHPHIKTMIETEALCQRYGIQQVLVHTIHETILRTPDGLTHEKTRFVAQPRSSTGAGDHFNGASCFALLAGLSDRDRVHFAGVFASTYVFKGQHPDAGRSAGCAVRQEKRENASAFSLFI